MEYYRTFPARDYLAEYRKRCFVIGRRVRIVTPQEDSATQQKKPDVEKTGREYAQVLDIDDACHLKVQYDDGTIEFLSSGEISIKM